MINEDNPLHVEAKTLELALVKAGAALGVPQEQVAYRVLKKDNSIAAFFARRKVELQVWNRDEVEKPQIDQDQLIEELTTYCRDLCTKIAGEEAQVKARLDGRRLILDVDNSFLLSSATRYPKTIEALEHLIRKKPRYLQQGLPFRIFVDVNNHRVERENELTNMAKDLAQKVIENKHPIVMNCKGSHERRVIHLALDGDHRIYTKSIGSGFDRKLMILPVKRSDPSGGVSASSEGGSERQ